MLCLGADDESLSKQIERITSRGQLSELQLKLESAETQRKRAKIEHERDIESITKDRQVLLPLSDYMNRLTLRVKTQVLAIVKTLSC